MKLDELKKGLWGYKKASVYAYITMMEEEFSTKLLEKDTQHQKSVEEYQAHIDALEQELHTVKQQLRHLEQNNEKMEIASTLIAATQYGEALRKEAEETAQKERQAWEVKLASAQRELEQYQGQIAQVQDLLHRFLENMDKQAQDVQQQAKAVQASSPDHNMTLFERKQEPEA